MKLQFKDRWKSEFEKASVETVRMMLSKEPELANEPVNHVTRNGSIRQWGSLYLASVHMKDLEKVKALVAAGANLSNSHLGTHWPSDDYQISRFFIECGIDVNQPSYLGFHGVGVSGLDTFYLMMSNGLDPNFAWPYNGETLLHVQSRHDDDTHLARAYSLIQAGADVNAQAWTGLDDEPIMENEHFITYGRETPLHFAARLGNPRQAQLLVDHGANPILKTVSRRIEPKIFSKWNKEVSFIPWPMKVTGFKRVMFEHSTGETPLEMAIRYNNHSVVKILS
ncbi:MAG TPA: ankyrin repeat domain-containing protein [Rhodospirillales bacterium]|nr:ankyrin repeat domain-containing protein [Rhodospirillales bacterium]